MAKDAIDKKERVNHPQYYNWIGGVECLDVVEHFGFNTGCVIKYVWRAETRPPQQAIEDYRKAIFYLQREIDLVEKTHLERK